MLSKLCTHNKVVGMKQVRKAVINNEADIVYIAKDAKDKVVSDIENICKEKLIDIVYVDTMKELGSSCGIDVSAATAAILK
ncbi:ribosomal L7Ae/L30e/S12e/Gadd45 family protein [Anaerosalibacter sp. Marseille-P3206]|uniref:ribosomal L7Ae/L30e/S12e/Gadd45 family protein n=1 Tax=Anaerosalibacter sp. Marseille-P3206 TaxID=1871005 RepID=UPI00098717EE|nr:ribosomal L7Ae/L30e/S12e/Gadd45 family protein [Anaerosalibacter sp. Marseille-P3206]